MEEAEPGRYVAQLKAEFDSCDTTATGFLDRDELKELCHRLRLDAHLPLLLDTLLRDTHYGRVNFEEFKDGLVSVLSHSLDCSTSEDDSSYLEPAVVPNEVKPKFVKGTKRYGRRSRPDSQPDGVCEDSPPPPPPRTNATDAHAAKLRRAMSLESVESLKSDEEAGSQKINQLDLQCKAPQEEEEEEEEGGSVGTEEGGAGGGGHVTAVCDHMTLQQQFNAEELDSVLRKLDTGLDGRVSVRHLWKVLCGSVPVSCSTPTRPADLQGALHRTQSLLEDSVARSRSPSPSLLTPTVGQRVLSCLDDGSGCTSPERVIALWTEEGIRNSRDILQTLDFPLEERLSLADLTLALDNELLVSGSGIHQAALISYKNEIQRLQAVAEQACRQRDKVRADLDLADQRNLSLVREVDDRHATMETLNQSRIRDLEQDFRDRLAAVRSQSEQESEALLEQAAQERAALQEELQLLRGQEVQLQEELCSSTLEIRRVEEELCDVKMKLTEARSSVSKLQADMDQLLHDKFGSLEAAGAALTQEERCCELVKEYELQCRELRDRNDELSSELELLKSQRSNRKSRSSGDTVVTWTEQHTVNAESDSEDADMKRRSSPQVKELQPAGPSALDSVSGPVVSIQTELALEQLRQKHKEELQQLRVQLDTQVNFYERSLELMRQSMEVERKDISQAFKLEISELEEHKAQAEERVRQLKEAVEKLQTQLRHGGAAGGWSSEQERRGQRERLEMEQNFAREISHLVQKLSAEKDQMEAELKVKMDQEVTLVREESEQQLHLEHLQQQQRGTSEKLWGEEREFSSDKKNMEEQDEEAAGQLKHQLSGFQETISQSEASLEELKERCDDVSANGNFLESQAASDSMEGEGVGVADRRGPLSDDLLKLQARLRDRDQTVTTLKVALKSMEEAVGDKAAEMDLIKTDRARLIQDLKEQAMAVDKLQLQLDGVSEELERSRRSERNLQEALMLEQTRSQKLLSSLEEEGEEVCRLGQENSSYALLADQLSTQVVEMEEEISTLRDHLRDVSCQLNETADLVLNLRRQLNSKTSEVDRLRSDKAELSSEKKSRDVQQLTVQLKAKNGEVERLQQDLQRLQEQLRRSEDEFEEEKSRMRQQLLELEQLVLALEEVMDPDGPHRTQLEEVRSENGALQERLNVLLQDVQNLEDDVAKKRRKLEEMERDHERSRREEEKLHKENSKYREEVLDLSSRNLQLSNDNAELSARLHGDQESVRLLRERLATVTKEQEEQRATVQRLQGAVSRQEGEKLQQQAAWTQERQALERELSTCKEKLGHVSKLEAELSAATLKLQWLEEDKARVVQEANDQRNKVETLQRSALSLESEAELLRSQLHAVTTERRGHAQDLSDLQTKLEEAHLRVEELQSSVRELLREKEELCVVLKEQEQQASISLQEETHRLRVHNQELQHKLTELQVKGQEVQKLTQEQQNLKTKLNELETAKTQAEKQAVRADRTLALLQAQHARRLNQLQEVQGDGCRERVELLEARLVEEQRRGRRLEETMRLQVQQSSSQISIKQGQYEKATTSMQQKMEDLETKLKGVRAVLQEKVQQLKDQLEKNTKLSALLKDLYVENSQLMKALQVTEQRQKNAEKKSYLLEEKVGALNNLLREIVPLSLAT